MCRLLAVFILAALAPGAARAQVFTPPRVVPLAAAPTPPAAPAPAPLTPDIGDRAGAARRFREFIARSRTSPMAAAPWGFGRCFFGVELPDSLGLQIARYPTPVTDVSAGPEWVTTALRGVGDTVVVVHVVGALCADSTAADPFFGRVHAVVELGGRFALASLARTASAVDARAARVRVAADGWREAGVLVPDSSRSRFVLRSLNEVERVEAAQHEAVAAAAQAAAARAARLLEPLGRKSFPSASGRAATSRPTSSVAARRTASRAAYVASPYVLGPRGGCYIYSASGRKRYVDRSLCH